jgi:hypothetical protein
MALIVIRSFLIGTIFNGIYNPSRVEPNLTAWPGNINILRRSPLVA